MLQQEEPEVAFTGQASLSAQFTHELIWPPHQLTKLDWYPAHFTEVETEAQKGR